MIRESHLDAAELSKDVCHSQHQIWQYFACDTGKASAKLSGRPEGMVVHKKNRARGLQEKQRALSPSESSAAAGMIITTETCHALGSTCGII